MKTSKKNKKLLIPLVTSTILIWGIIIYSVVEYFNSSDDNSIEIIDQSFDNITRNPNKKKTALSKDVKYTELKRDPFKFPKIRKPKPPKPKAQNPKPKVAKVPSLKYKINGVIINEESKMVIFEDLTNKTTLFLREGEEYKTIKIAAIGSNKVTLIYEKAKKEIKLQN